MHLNHVGSWGLTLPEHRLLSHIPGGSDSAGLGRWRGEAVRFAFLTSSQVILGTHIENHWFRRLVAPRRKHNPGLFFFSASLKPSQQQRPLVISTVRSQRTEVKMWNYTENGMRYQLHACGIWSCQHLHGRHIVTAALRCSYLCFREWNASTRHYDCCLNRKQISEAVSFFGHEKFSNVHKSRERGVMNPQMLQLWQWLVLKLECSVATPGKLLKAEISWVSLHSRIIKGLLQWSCG